MGGLVALEEGDMEEMGQGNDRIGNAPAQDLLSEVLGLGIILLVATQGQPRAEY